MSWYPDLSTNSMVAKGDHVRAVGWLSVGQPYAQGSVPLDFVLRLREFVNLANESSEALYFGAYGGFHTCEFCGQAQDTRNFGVPAGEHLFVAPAMIGHYVEEHKYAPPAEFIAAVADSPLPGTVEYTRLAEPFSRLQQQALDQERQRRVELAGRWAAEQGGTDEAVQQASMRFFGNWLPQTCEKIRQCMPSVRPDSTSQS